jgi:hypothetical protein
MFHGRSASITVIGAIWFVRFASLNLGTHNFERQPSASPFLRSACDFSIAVMIRRQDKSPRGAALGERLIGALCRFHSRRRAAALDHCGGRAPDADPREYC